MKNLLLFISFFLAGNFTKAQINHDLTVFSSDGVSFTLFVNGQQVNEKPQASVTFQTPNDYAKVKLVFSNDTIPTIEKKMLQIAEPGTGVKRPCATVYEVKSKKEELVLKFVSRSVKTIPDSPVIIINNR